MCVFYRLLFLLGAICSLLGCAGESRVFQESMSAIWSSNKFKDGTVGLTPNPAYRYLRVSNSRGIVLMALGYVDADPTSNPPVEVWYSGDKEVVKFQNGRIVATSGLSADWLAARYQNIPNWTQLLANPAQAPSSYSRSVDLKNNYQFGKAQTITLARIVKPAAHTLQGVPRSDVVWFEEKATPSELPASIYAIVPNWLQSGQAKVVYAWHCLQADECFGFQEWTVADQSAAIAASASRAVKP